MENINWQDISDEAERAMLHLPETTVQNESGFFTVQIKGDELESLLEKAGDTIDDDVIVLFTKKTEEGTAVTITRKVKLKKDPANKYGQIVVGNISVLPRRHWTILMTEQTRKKLNPLVPNKKSRDSLNQWLASLEQEPVRYLRSTPEAPPETKPAQSVQQTPRTSGKR